MKGRKPKASSSRASDNKLAVKKGAKKVEKKGKGAKDPNKPKRPPSAFFVFMEGFRKEFKEKNPRNKSVAAVGKAGGERWKSLSDADKAPFQNKAEKLKAEYEKKIAAYNRGETTEENVVEEEESDKSKSEVNDDEEEGTGSEEDDDEDED
ncbi:HMG1/2-like protein [Asparagus officinalis]|uniref:HMG1/2-like protein n=1 Tax=Asparagus officinalis TaxID=4686 RepID=UPI00098E1C5B|nr:HMG1/2-like protein [Asparagus officinalis]